MNLVKAFFINLDDSFKTPAPVSFNPSSYSLSRSNNYKEINHLGGINQDGEFLWQNMDSLQLELFFDTTDTGIDVRIPAYRVVRLTKVNQLTGKLPELMFVWGTLAFSCIMEKVEQHYEQFSPMGWPLRAKLNVSLKGYDNYEKVLDTIPPALALVGYVVSQSNALQDASSKAYGDARKWRPIAKANNIVNPLTVKTGIKLNIPKL